MEITKLSTKGQIVIPEEIRRNINVGTPFVVTKKDDLIVLKIVEGLTREEMDEIKEINKIWKEIDSGKCKSYTEKEFFKKLKEW